MGGRGSSSGGGSYKTASRLIDQFQNQNGIWPAQLGTGQFSSTLTLAPAQLQGDYTDNGNPDLIKWQGQTDDKSASFLSKVDNTTDLKSIQTNTNDPWPFYDNPQQKLVEQLNLNAKPTVLSDADFDRYVKATGATVLYRGWSGKDASDRFNQSPNSHIGNGINGDGYYFAPDAGTAKGYGNYGTRAALSPNARVVSVDTVNAAISNASPKFRSALGKAGAYGTRTFGGNSGQAQMALKMGYNCIDAGWAVIPLTRDAVVTSSKRAW